MMKQLLFIIKIILNNEHNNKYILCCDFSGIKFVNESVINNKINNLYEKMDIYKFFQSKNNDLNSIINRDLNFKFDNIRRYKNIEELINNKILRNNQHRTHITNTELTELT